MWIRFLPSAEGPAWLPPAASWRVSSSFSISEHTRAISGPAAGLVKIKEKKANVRVIVSPVSRGWTDSETVCDSRAEFLRLTTHGKWPKSTSSGRPLWTARDREAPGSAIGGCFFVRRFDIGDGLLRR